MRRCQQNSFSWSRAIGASGLFIAVLCSIVWAAASFFSRTDSIFSGDTSPKSPSHRGQLFYTSIGKSSTSLTKAKSRTQSPIRRQTYTLEITSLESAAAAEESIKSLDEQGIQAYYTPLQKDGRVIYRVRTGVFVSKASAELAQGKLKAEQKISATVSQLY